MDVTITLSVCKTVKYDMETFLFVHFSIGYLYYIFSYLQPYYYIWKRNYFHIYSIFEIGHTAGFSEIVILGAKKLASLDSNTLL